MAQSKEFPDLVWIPPRSWTVGRRAGQPNVIVWHYTAGHEGPGAAEAGAAYDARRTDGTSAHFHIDPDSVVQCVLTSNEAHTARRYGNDVGVHLELAGTRQSRAQWLDPVSRATIRNSAWIAARVMRKYDIPNERLTVAQLRRTHPLFGNSGQRGIVGHVDCTYAFPEDKGDHTDPGAEFPWDVLQADIDEFLLGGIVADALANLDELATVIADGTTERGYPQNRNTLIHVTDAGNTIAGVRAQLADGFAAVLAKLDALAFTPTDAQVSALADRLAEHLAEGGIELELTLNEQTLVSAAKRALREGAGSEPAGGGGS